jgi:hypothetical protein
VCQALLEPLREVRIPADFPFFGLPDFNLVSNEKTRQDIQSVKENPSPILALKEAGQLPPNAQQVKK